jgi:hypothetical protein
VFAELNNAEKALTSLLRGANGWLLLANPSMPLNFAHCGFLEKIYEIKSKLSVFGVM